MKVRTKSQNFPGQAIYLFSPALREETGRHQLGAGLHVISLGWFPRARNHRMQRPDGCNEFILIYCRKGKGWFEIDGQRHSLGQHEALLIPGIKPHAYGADEKDPWSIDWVHFSGNAAVAYSSLLQPQEYVLPLQSHEAGKVEKLFRESCRVLSTGKTSRAMLYVSQILRHILGLLFFQGTTVRKGFSKCVAHDLSESIQFMRGNLRRSLSLKELSKQAGLSSARYSALFREQTGVSPVEHFIRLRMQAACHLLDTSSMSVKEVADQLGYDDAYYFSRVFRKTIGYSPLAYRRSMKG
jgi:AraC family transcriptional regulator of arabinose operon